MEGRIPLRVRASQRGLRILTAGVRQRLPCGETGPRTAVLRRLRNRALTLKCASGFIVRHTQIFDRLPMPRTTTTQPRTAGAMQIGAIAARTGVTVEALRYYEKRGLVRPIARKGSGYREYGADSVRVVLFIKRAQALGFSLTEVEELVRLRERAWVGDAPRVLRDAAVTKIEDIDSRIRQLGALRNALAELVSACDTACPVEPQASGCECEPSRGTAVGALPCPLIEALDPVLDGGTQVEVEPIPVTASATRDANSEPVTRRPKARRPSLARKP